MIVRILSTIAVACSLAGAAGAQTDACDTRSGPPSSDFEFYAAEQWPQEAARYKSNGQPVSREAGAASPQAGQWQHRRTGRLPPRHHGSRLSVSNYDEIGRFFVVRRPAFKDFSYTLVMRRRASRSRSTARRSGRTDKSRFLTIACSWLPPRGTLTIHPREGGAITTEAEIPLPTCLDETETCSARWDNPSWIAVTCTRTDGSSRKGSEFVVMRGSDGVWKTFGRWG